MDKLFKISGTVFFIVWALVGGLFLIGLASAGAFLASGEAGRMMQTAIPAMMGGSEMMEGLEGSEAMMEFQQKIETCLKESLGEKRASEIMKGSYPTKEEEAKVAKTCADLLPTDS